MVPDTERRACSGATAARARRTSPASSRKPPSVQGVERLFEGRPPATPAPKLAESAYADIVVAARADRHAALALYDGKGDRAKPSPRTESTSDVQKARAHQQSCYDKCGGTERGSIECKLGADGMPTASVEVTIRETDPCTRPCVEKHEAIHAADIAPVCRSVADCLKKAASDRAKQDRCLDAYQATLYGMVGGAAGTECKAYSAELTCLDQRKATKECKQSDGPKHWAESVARTKCYHDCFCTKPG